MDLAIYVGSIDHFLEGGWLPSPPLPPLPEGLKVTELRVIGQTDRKTQQERIRRWRDRLTTELGEWLSTPLDWDETERQHAVADTGWNMLDGAAAVGGLCRVFREATRRHAFC
jgi:hypothetical protein